LRSDEADRYPFWCWEMAFGLLPEQRRCRSRYGAASLLITLLLWVYYSSRILLFGAEFTQVYAAQAGLELKPSEYAVLVQTNEGKGR
jgi:membrane protein